jgi:hypothetical protein
MNFHSLNKDQVAVVLAERSTGIILTPGGQRYLGSGEAFRAFSSRGEARAFAQGVVNTKPEVECGLYDSTGTRLERIVRTE